MRTRLSDGNAPTSSLRDHSAHVRAPREAVLEVTNATEADYERALSSAWIPDPAPGDSTPWESRLGLLRVLAALAAILRPTTAVEVGVERGYSSAVLLHAMCQNRAGRLFSIDLPPLHADSRQFTGAVIPDGLREGWDLTLGPSAQKLPQVLARCGPVDLFLHDGDHSYGSQTEDLGHVWPHLRVGAVVVVDDVWTDSLVDFGRAVNETPLLIERWDEHDAVGLMRRSR